MSHAIVRATVEDFDKWKKGFDEAASVRKAYGSKGVRVFRSVEKPNEVIILGEYEDLQKARQMFQSQEFREATQRSGVAGKPDVTLADEVHQLPA
jgi:heme-degrading monooxygenase HmoA